MDDLSGWGLPSFVRALRACGAAARGTTAVVVAVLIIYTVQLALLASLAHGWPWVPPLP